MDDMELCRRKKSVSIMEDAKKPIEITNNGKKWKGIKIGIDIEKMILKISTSNLSIRLKQMQELY